MLFKRIATRDDEFEFLVIELKAPKDPLREKEASQIKRYANAVSSDDQFPPSKWTFLLVNNKIEDTLDKERNQQNRPSGLLVDFPEHKVWVKKWSEIISDARARHEWLRKQLNLQLSDDADGLKYLAENYPENLPEKLRPSKKDR